MRIWPVQMYVGRVRLAERRANAKSWGKSRPAMFSSCKKETSVFRQRIKGNYYMWLKSGQLISYKEFKSHLNVHVCMHTHTYVAHVMTWIGKSKICKASKQAGNSGSSCYINGPKIIPILVIIIPVLVIILHRWLGILALRLQKAIPSFHQTTYSRWWTTW